MEANTMHSTRCKSLDKEFIDANTAWYIYTVQCKIFITMCACCVILLLLLLLFPSLFFRPFL